VWNEEKGGISLNTWNYKGEVIYITSRRYLLPKGWVPVAWNPNGTRLLVASNREIRLWSPASPNAVGEIGPMPKGITIGEYAWLAGPAKL
jgi:hypothetical protein